MWVSLLLLFSFFSRSLSSNPRISEAGLFCGNPTPPRNGYIPNFVREMEVLSELVAEHHWGQHVVNSTTPIYGLAQCHNDLSHTDCLLCYAVSRTRLPHCLPSVSARIYLDGCFLRYDTFDFFNQSVDPVQDKVNCSASGKESAIDGGKKLEFKGSVREVIGNVTDLAVRNGGFAVWEGKGVFGLAQCWRTVSSDGCRECLEKAAMEVRDCAPSNEGRGLNAGCYLRYSTVKFFNTKPGNSQASSGSSKVGLTVTIALAIAAFLMLSLFATYACYLRASGLKQELYSLRELPTSFKKSNLSLRYEMLEKATDYFSASRKLGQGSAGSVFKGTLPDGEIVAVKRLFFNTRQWVDEFFNEVNLISSVQHKNLVKLLGCSIEGPESLLVFEYVPNNSLDQVLFDKNKVETLNWRQRVDIIVGTAEGLAHLHDGTGTRIIHRDIKSSNVLLDENFAPKIADFGLARCFGTEMSHLSTGIAGTLGYMAPEYLVRGQLTEKADVYSFGVLVLEIISGRKNTTLTENFGSLLQTVWNLYITNRLSDCVDPRLQDVFPAEEASRVLQIGLLCAQASAALRPSMKEVVHMLTITDSEIHLPNQPPFLNAGSMKLANSSRIHGLNSLVSSTLRKIEASSSSTGTSSMPSSNDQSRSVEIDSK